MRNCTVADSALSSTNEWCTGWFSVEIGSSASVVNTVVVGVTNRIDGAPARLTGTRANFLSGAYDGPATGLPAETIIGSAENFFRDCAAKDYKIKYQPKSLGPLSDKGADYSPMALYDLSGKQKRKIGSHVDIGCYEGHSRGTLFLVK